MELKSCPFCGSEWTQAREYMHNYAGFSKLRWYGECCDCGATTRDCDSEEEAARLWNARGDETAMRGPMIFRA